MSARVCCVSRLTCRAQSRDRRLPDRSSLPPPPLPQPAAPARLSPNKTNRAKIIRAEPEAGACSQEILPSFFLLPVGIKRKKERKCIPAQTSKKKEDKGCTSEFFHHPVERQKRRCSPFSYTVQWAAASRSSSSSSIPGHTNTFRSF